MNDEHRYIQRFRNPEKLSGEGGYYLSSLVSLFLHQSVYLHRAN